MNTGKKALIVVIILVSFTFFLSACSTQEKDKQKYFKNALEYIEQDRWDVAILELRSAIQLDAKYGEARYQLGLLYLKEGDFQKAMEELVRAADLLPDNLDAHAKVASLYLMAGKKEESRSKLSYVLGKDPAHTEALALLATIELSDKNFDKALATLEKAGPALENSGELQNLKGRVHAAQNQWQEAEAAFQKAIAVDSANFIHYKGLLFLYGTQKEEDKFNDLLDEIAEKFPENAEAHLLQASFFHSKGDTAKAGEELQKVVDIDPKNPLFRLKLADYYKQIGKLDKAEETLVKAEADLEKNPEITAALASFYFDQGKFEEAKLLFDKLTAESPKHGGTQLLHARFLLKEGKPRESLSILQALNKNFPDWPEPFYYLGIAHSSLGEIDFAQQAVATAIQKNKLDYRYHMLLAQLFLTKGSYEDAKKEAATALKINPKNLRSALILSRAFIGTKEFNHAITILTDMNKYFPRDVEILGNLAMASLGAGDNTKAEKYLVELLQIDPGHIQTIALLAGLRHKNDPRAAEDFVRQQITQAPTDHRLYYFLGNLLEEQAKNTESLAAYDKALELDPDNAQAMLAAAKLLKRMGKNSEAMEKCSAITEKNPKSIPGKMCIAALNQEDGSPEEAIKQYKEILEIKGDYAPAANNVAWLLASQPDGDLGQALMFAMTAKQALPDDPSVADTLGWVHYKRGSFALAISQFEFALQIKESNPTFTYHLALAQSGNDQKQDAFQTLDKLLASKVEFADRKKAEELLAELKKNM